MAERLRRVSTATDLIYRVSDTRFALTLFETESESLEQAQERVLKSLSEERVLAGRAIFDPEEPVSLEDLICEASGTPWLRCDVPIAPWERLNASSFFS